MCEPRGGGGLHILFGGYVPQIDDEATDASDAERSAGGNVSIRGRTGRTGRVAATTPGPAATSARWSSSLRTSRSSLEIYRFG